MPNDSDQYDIFVSYARRDNDQGCVTQLVDKIKENFKRLAGRELKVFFDQTEIRGMDDWRNRLWQGLRESKLLLTCLSPAYFQSPNCEWEVVEYLKYEIGHRHGLNGIAPVYFVTVPGLDRPGFDSRDWVAELLKRQRFDLRPWHELGLEVLRQADVQAQMDHLGDRIFQAIRRGEQADASQTNVDAPNPHFIGRTATMRQINDNFAKPGHIGVLTAVHGLGGLGKTALAIEYAHAFADKYGGGRWQLRCAGKDDLRLALSELATPIGFEFTDDEKKSLDLQFDRTRRELKLLADARTPHRCLLLLDNVDQPALLDPAQVARLNAGDWMHLLATTRLGKDELHGTQHDRSFVPVDELMPDDALTLIEEYQPDRRFSDDAERAAAWEIVRLLGGFTLAVESAAVYLGQFAHDVTCSDFLTLLQKEGLEGLESAATQSTDGVRHGEKRLRATLQPTLDRLDETERLALEYAALLPADQVPLPWLRVLVAKTFPAMAKDAETGYPDPWKSLLRRLFSLRLIQLTSVVDKESQPRVVRVHRLVQELVKLNCTDAEKARYQLSIDELIQQRIIVLDKEINWVQARWELEPFSALAILWDKINHPGTTFLLNQSALFWHKLAEWSRAEPMMLRALTITREKLGPEHPEYSATLNNLAQLLKDTNRLKEAEPLMRQALSIEEKNFGPNHPSFATVLNNLAQLLQETNRMAEAEPIMHRVLSILTDNFGENHPEIARSLNNLALLLQATNRLIESEPLLRRALAIDQKFLGPDHPDVTRDLKILAHFLKITNRLEEAEPLMRRALSLDEKHFGSDHPNIAMSLNNLGQLLLAANRQIEAEPLMVRALAINEKRHGPDHPNVAICLSNLAAVQFSMGSKKEVETLMLRHLEIFLKFTISSGHPHQHLQAAFQNYAAYLSKMGYPKKEVMMKLVAICKQYGIQYRG